MNMRYALTFFERAVLGQGRQVPARRGGLILWAIVAGLMILLLTLLAFRSVVQTAAGMPASQLAGAALDVDEGGLQGQAWIDIDGDGVKDGLENGPPDILLNGLPAGNNVMGVITVPLGLSGTLGVQVAFGDQPPQGPSDILLELDYGADGVTDAVSAAVVIGPPEFKVYLPAILRPK